MWTDALTIEYICLQFTPAGEPLYYDFWTTNGKMTAWEQTLNSFSMMAVAYIPEPGVLCVLGLFVCFLFVFF